MSRIAFLIAGVAVMLVLAAPSGAMGPTKLKGTVGPGFTITLKMSSTYRPPESVARTVIVAMPNRLAALCKFSVSLVLSTVAETRLELLLAESE